MKTHARVAVIGGGVVGCSVLYHLAKAGWTDVVLLERAELTSGSTWHAAGGMHTLNGDPNVAALQAYTINLYQEIERASGVSCGVHRSGCLYLASTEKEMDVFLVERGKARYLGVGLEFIELSEIQGLNPLVDTSSYRCAMFDPNDGHVDPSGVTHAYAEAARKLGAEIYRQTPVTAIARAGCDWEISTPQVRLRCEVVVNAAGLWAREVARMLGVTLPIVPMEHQYLITNDIPELAAFGRETAMVVDFNAEAYLRQERLGLLLGTYERDCRHWAVNGTPMDFGMQLLAPDLERIAQPLTQITQRIPALGRAGVRRVVNGGMVFAPDGNPIIGPVPGLPNAFVAVGTMAGFSQGGGVGLALGNWITQGEPGMDVAAMDIARFGSHVTPAYVLEKTRENYQRRFVLPSPNEELLATRPLYTTPIYEPLRAAGAVFGAIAGYEVPLWFADDAAQAHETPSFRRTPAHAAVARECEAVRERVGLLETSCYCKIRVRGADAREWLDSVVANRVPAIGRLAICPMLTPNGRVLGDVTVAALAPEDFLVMGSPAAEAHYLRWLNHCAMFPVYQSKRPNVRITAETSTLCGFSLTGPLARDLLARVSPDDVSNEAFPFLSIRDVTVGLASVRAFRISFTGELGYELYVEPQLQRHVLGVLTRAGREFDLRHFGVRALNALRLEKGYGGWGREFTQDHDVAESGLGRFVCLEKGEFVGRSKAAEALAGIPRSLLRLLAIDSQDPDPIGGEPLIQGAGAIGRLTSAAFSHRFGHALGFAYLPRAIDSRISDLRIELLGKPVGARVLNTPPYDPSGARLRL